MKILIVEDSKFAQMVTAGLFSQDFPDVELILADNGMDGYDKFLQSSPDIIITDLLMPCMSGQELVKKIREIDQNIKIIIVTADIQKSTRDELAEYHIAAFINKPLVKDKMALVKPIVEGRQHA